MRKIKLFSLAFAAIAMSLASCVKKEENHLTPDEIFHVVHFETESSETKTTMNIEGSTVNFAWEATDYDAKLQRFHVWENENEAVRVVPTYSTGKISLDASFAGELPVSPQYVGYFNGKVPALQVPRTSTNQYDADSDVLIAESRIEEGQLLFYFKRVVAIGKLTLKGIDEGEILQSVTFELAEDSDQFLTGSLQRDNNGEDGWAWTTTGKKITLNCNIPVTAGNVPVLYFTSVPVTDGQFTVKAVTDKNTYTKEFSKTISLTRGNVKGMSMTLEKDEKPTVDYELTVSHAPSGYNSSASNIYNQDGVVFKAANIMKNGNNQPSGYNASQFIQMKSSQCSLYNDTELSLKTVKIIYQSGTFALQTKAQSSDSWSSSVSGTSGTQVISGLKTTSGSSTIADTDAKAKLNTLTYNLSGKKYFRIQPSATTYVYKIIVTVGESTPTGVKLAAPANLSVNADKQIVWDRVENAVSYNVYINDGAAIPVTDHYYDASTVADGYYNVAVEAVPANSEMFVTSDKATLTNAKFGTPTLATPEPEVAKTDKTVTLRWNVDAHANGYTYTLYKGEDVVESPTANYSVAEGVATLVYSNLSPKTAYSVKVNATLVESPLRYEASEVYTTDDITTLSTINYSVLQNGTYSDQTTCAAVGDPVYFTATPSAGYEFDSVSVTGIEAGDIERAGDIFTFTMPDLAEVTVAVNFKQSGFTLGTSLLDSETDHGTVVIDSPKERYTVTDVIALTVTPEAHYEYASVSAEETGEGTNSIEAILNEETEKYEIRGLHFNAELVAYFNKINYAIAVAEGIANGTVTRGSETATYNQENVSFTVKPATGYDIATVTVSGESGNVEVVAGDTDAQGTHYTFTMPGEPVTINATFDAIVYNITDNSGENGSLSFKVNDAEATTATIGQTVTITVTPAQDWYQLKAGTLKVNGTITPQRDGETNQYTFTMPDANVTVAAQFELVPYEVKDQTLSGTSLSATHGQLKFRVESGSAASTVSATFGQTVTVVPSPVEGYEMSTLKLYQKSTTWSESNKVDYDPEALTFTQPAYAVSAKAEFVKKNYNITNGGVTSGTGSFEIKNSNGDVISSAQMGDVITLDAEYAEGFKVVWTVSDNVTDLKADATDKSKATFTMPAGEVTVSAAIEEVVNTNTAVYTVASTTSVNASGITPTGSSATFKNTYTSNKEQITEGKSQTLTLKGYQGKIIKSITLTMHSNGGAGAGTLSVKAGTTTLASIASATSFNNSAWNGAYTTEYTDVTPAMTNTSYSIKKGEDIVIVIAGTTNSLFCQKFAVEYADDPNYVETYGITLTQPSGGEIEAKVNGSAVTSAVANATVTLNVVTTPTGKTFSAWKVVKKSGGEVAVTGNTFTMPAEEVTVSATFTGGSGGVSEVSGLPESFSLTSGSAKSISGSSNSNATLKPYNNSGTNVSVTGYGSGFAYSSVPQGAYYIITIPNVSVPSDKKVTLTCGGVKTSNSSYVAKYKTAWSLDGSSYTDFGNEVTETATATSRSGEFEAGEINNKTLYIKIYYTQGNNKGNHYLGTVTVSTK